MFTYVFEKTIENGIVDDYDEDGNKDHPTYLCCLPIVVRTHVETVVMMMK